MITRRTCSQVLVKERFIIYTYDLNGPVVLGVWACLDQLQLQQLSCKTADVGHCRGCEIPATADLTHDTRAPHAPSGLKFVPVQNFQVHSLQAS